MLVESAKRDSVLMIDEPVSEVTYVLDLGIPICLVACANSYESLIVLRCREFIELPSLNDTAFQNAKLQTPKYAISFTEKGVPGISAAAEKLYLEGSCPTAALPFFYDKMQMRKVLSNFGNRVNFYSLPKLMNGELPCGSYVVKPNSGTGSESVFLVKVLNGELSWPEEINFQPEPNREYTVETFLHGQEYSTDCFVRDGVVTILGIAAKGTQFKNSFVESSHLVGPVLSDEHTEQLRILLERIFQQVGYVVGCSHVEFKVTEQRDIQFIEFHPRPGGDELIPAIAKATGNELGDYLVSYWKGAPTPMLKTIKGWFFIQFLMGDWSDTLAELSKQIPKHSFSYRKLKGNLEQLVPHNSAGRDFLLTIYGETWIEFLTIFHTIKTRVPLDSLPMQLEIEL